MTEKEPTLKDVVRAIEDLGSVTAKGFLRVEKRFEKVDKKIETEIGSVKSELKSDLKKEIRSVKVGIHELNINIREQREDIHRLDDRIGRLENQTHGNIDLLFEQQEKMSFRITKIETKTLKTQGL